ncbi:acetyltransferase (GNAT) family protein [Jatrophihabitans sp. GAS493]|uniref:GNAT family N-acetyltransferase n=1 Tax=Jatrophihabitans sp. GAS493 TaxID=1907575 RepID=UPI000BB99A95|nr:GNAT family N-acetyltransferase [Jatrophihabitans sp. GAS493]SOD74797.1 acetyltransferase (GNAT) family protein [Jatrophihabitans sp. GAS493]
MVSIAKFDPGDRTEWERLFVAYNVFYEQSYEPSMYDRAWALFQQDSVMHAYGATVDGKLVGFTHFLVHASTTAPDVCYLEDLYTDPTIRGRGVGRALIEAVTEWARARQCSRVYWLTRETNSTARRLYDQVADNSGFIVYEIPL